MKSITIKGDFTIEGDLPGLNLLCKRFKVMKINLREPPPVAFIDTFCGLNKKESKTLKK